MIKILDADNKISFASYLMKLGQPLDIAFPKSQRPDASDSLIHLINALNWIWLQTHKGLAYQEVTNVASHIVKRSLTFCATREGESRRDKHDYVLLNIVILVGDQDLIDEVLGFVSVADENAEQPNWFRAHTGILKCCMMGDHSQAQRQYEIMNLCKGKQPAIRVAAKPVLRSLIANNVKPMPRQIKSVTDSYWKELQRIIFRPVLYEDDEIRLGGLWADDNRFWPWPEAVAMKLMARGGAKIQADEFWLPKQLISG